MSSAVNVCGRKMDMSYYSIKYVRIPDRRLGMTYYAIIGLVAFYIGIGQILMARGYQRDSQALTNTMLKVRGATRGYLDTNDAKSLIIDAKDIQVDALKDSYFLPVRQASIKQKRDTCEGLEGSEGLCNCEIDGRRYGVEECCVKGEKTEFGLKTGKCGAASNSTKGGGGKYCEVEAWCPITDASKLGDQGKIIDIRDFEVLIRADVSFADTDFRTSTSNGTTPGYNLFTINEILNTSNVTWDAVEDGGGIFHVDVSGHCNLDKRADRCKFKINWRSITDAVVKNDTAPAPGVTQNLWNSKGLSTRTIVLNSDGSRTYTRKDGILLTSSVSVTGGMFSLAALLMCAGAGAGMLSVASLIIDNGMRIMGGTGSLYRSAKFMNQVPAEMITEEDVYEVQKDEKEKQPNKDDDGPLLNEVDNDDKAE